MDKPVLSDPAACRDHCPARPSWSALTRAVSSQNAQQKQPKPPCFVNVVLDLVLDVDLDLDLNYPGRHEVSQARCLSIRSSLLAT